MATVTIKMEMPTTCGKCTFYSEPSYQCHNERGQEAYCALDYMRGNDMRDRSYRNSRFGGCQLKED